MQPCPICTREFNQNPNYPHQVCPECVSAAKSMDGRRIRFSVDTDQSRLRCVFSDTGEDYSENICYVEGHRCEALKTHMNEIIIQLMPRESFVEEAPRNRYLPDLKMIAASMTKVPVYITTAVGLLFIIFGNSLPKLFLLGFLISSLVIGVRITLVDKSHLYLRMLIESGIGGLLNALLSVLFIISSKIINPELQLSTNDADIVLVLIFFIFNMLLAVFTTFRLMRSEILT
jgi:hypothetical protein